MNPFTITGFGCAALCAALAGISLVMAPRKVSAVAFAAAILGTASLAFGLGMRELGAGGQAVFWESWTIVTLLLLGPPWLLFSVVFGRENWVEVLGQRASLVAGVSVLALILAVAYLTGILERLEEEVIARSTTYTSEGPEGPPAIIRSLVSPPLYLNLFLLGISAVILSTVERTFRSAHELQRWQIKHLLLGIALIFGFLTFSVAQALVQGNFDFGILRFAPIAVLAACGCMGISVYRKPFDIEFRISHSFAYSSIALIASGLYLILMGTVVKQMGRSTESQYIAVLTAFIALLALPLLLLSTSFRLRARHWLGRNLFRFRYDYREQWLRAVEVLHPEPRIEAIAEKLAEFVEIQLGVKEISTWIRKESEGRQELHLLSARENPSGPRAYEAGRLIHVLEKAQDPFEVDAFLARTDLGSLSPGREIFDALRPTLCAPLVSGSHLVGILLLGERVTGEPPYPEDLEFLKVLAGHAASQLHNAQLLEGQLRAKEADAFRLLSTFLIHDLKNFTSTLTLISQNAARHGNNPEFLQDAFRSVGQIAGTMNRLCANLKSLSGGFRVEPQPGDLRACVEAEVAGFTAETGSRVSLDITPLPALSFDRGQIATVLRNLLLNAREAAGPEGWISVSMVQKDVWAIIEVRDGGPGIPREFLEKELFLPFRTTKIGGTGIGLFQSKSIVEAHGGRIDVESEEGKGTLVRILLHAEREPAPPAGSALLSGRPLEG